MCGKMFVQFLLLFLTALNCAAGYGGGHHHKPYEFVHEAQHWPSEYWSEEPQFHNAFKAGSLLGPPVSHRVIHQGNGIRDYSNPQRYVNEPQRYVNQPQQYLNQPYQHVNHHQQYVNEPHPEDSSGYFDNKPMSPPTPLFPTITPLPYIVSVSYSSSSSLVMGGYLAKVGEFSYMVAIGYNRQGGGYDYQCGGTLISSLYVLTAAHCRTSGGRLATVVKPGGARLDDNSLEYKPIEIMDIIVHPNYKRKQVYDDIALIRLKKAPYGYPACLWTKDDINYNTATAIGYGQTATRLSTSNDLYKVDLQLYSSQVCQAYYTPRFRIERGLIDSQICAGDFNKAKDTCPGDSGGPLLVRTKVNDNDTEIHFILGVTSFGPGCAEGIPGVYTKVSSYIDWIKPIVWSAGQGFMLKCTN